MTARFWWCVLGGMCLVLSGCLARPLVRPSPDAGRMRQSQAIEQAVLATARTGDWLVIRGYHATDALVANATGIPLSHVAVYNGELRAVVGAEGSGVQQEALADFIARADRVLVIRPRWRSEENAAQVWAATEALVGKSYDYLGTLGFNQPGRYYCSELAIHVYRPWLRGNERFPKVIKPGEMYLFGVVLYDSLDREEREDARESATVSLAPAIVKPALGGT